MHKMDEVRMGREGFRGALYLQEIGSLQRRPYTRFEVLEGSGSREALSHFPQPPVREARVN